MNVSLNKAYSAVLIPTNYISTEDIQFTHNEQEHGYYYCNVFSRINAHDLASADSYQTQMTTRSNFRNALKDILEIGPTDRFEMLYLVFDIVKVADGESGDDSDATEIIIWFLGVSAVCAIGALILIIAGESSADRAIRRRIETASI